MLSTAADVEPQRKVPTAALQVTGSASNWYVKFLQFSWQMVE